MLPQHERRAGSASSKGEESTRELVRTQRDVNERLVLSSLRAHEEAEAAYLHASATEARFQLLVHSVRDYAIFILDPHGIVTTWNSGAKRSKGYDADEIIGKHFSVFYTREDVEAGTCDQELETAEREGSYEAEAWHVRKDGSLFWANTVLTALRDPHTGSLVGFARVTRDLTEHRRAAEERLRLATESTCANVDARKRAEEARDQALAALQESEERYSALFERSPFPLVLTSMPEGVTEAANQAFLDLFAASREDVVHRTSADFGISDPKSRAEMFAMLREHGNVRNFECERQTKDGRRLLLALNLDQVNVRGQEFILTTVQDVSIRKTQDEALARALKNVERSLASERDARREAEAANCLKDEFLATMSHELRTPLNAILGWSKLLRRGPRDEKSIDRALETIERNANTQTRLIEDILDVSRIITGKLHLEMRRVDMNAIVRAAVDVVRPAADAKRVHLVVDIAPEEGVEGVFGDADRLQQIVWNLLSNAVKFTSSEGTVSLRIERVEGTERVIVQDTGAGIPPEHLPIIFERFRQVDSSTTKRFAGLGLGLAIVRHLVEMHGGSVTVDSEGPGLGSTFTVTLLTRAIYGAKPEGKAKAMPSTAKSQPASTLSGVKVLVVDNDEDSRHVVESALERVGASVKSVDSARAAIDFIENHPVDVMISDIGMPDEDGYSLMRRVRALPETRGGQVKAIALTAYARDDDAMRARQVGYQRHLAKPADVDDLTRSVAELVAH
jgi:PAS domain S-box-containing protein